MTQSDFSQLLSRIEALTPQQMRRLRERLDRECGEPKTARAPTSGKGGKQTKPGKTPKTARTIEDLHRKMMARGLISRLPDPSLDIDDDDPDDQPVSIEGEPLSETIIRERR
jgi:hypothetical protein